MTTRELINTLPEKHRKTIETYSDLIALATARGVSEDSNDYSKKLRGYLTCMKDADIISDYGLRALYLWYRSERVRCMLRDGAV